MLASSLHSATAHDCHRPGRGRIVRSGRPIDGTASTSPDPQTFCGVVQHNDGGGRRLSAIRRKALLGICSLLVTVVGVLAEALPSTAVTTPGSHTSAGAPTAVASPNAYIALGDSYGAGPGIPTEMHSACQR